MGGFKKQATQPLLSKAISESEFENGGRATKIDSAPKLKRKAESKNKDNKVFSVLYAYQPCQRIAYLQIKYSQ